MTPRRLTAGTVKSNGASGSSVNGLSQQPDLLLCPAASKPGRASPQFDRLTPPDSLANVGGPTIEVT
jgi:hypothetical protein